MEKWQCQAIFKKNMTNGKLRLFLSIYIYKFCTLQSVNHFPAFQKSQKPLKGGSLKFNSPSSYKTSELQTKTLKFDESSCKIPDPKDLPSDFQKKLSTYFSLRPVL